MPQLNFLLALIRVNLLLQRKSVFDFKTKINEVNGILKFYIKMLIIKVN